MNAITEWDLSALRAIEGIRNDVLTFIMKFFTYMGDKGILWISLCILLIAIPKTRKIGIYAAAALAFQFILGEGLLKHLICRDRPFAFDDSINTIITRPTTYSFPSGHTSSSMAVSFSVFFQNKKLGAPLVLIAFMIAFSRLYFMVHFPTDIIGGFVLGLSAAIAVFFILNYYFKKRANKKTA